MKEEKLKLLTEKNWRFDPEKQILEKLFVFRDFLEAVAFINKIAPEAERISHHPDLSLTYNKLKISLTTHDLGQVTEKDLELALTIEEQV